MPNTYPDVDATSTIKAFRENEVTISESGVIRGQDLNADDLYRITITHLAISSSDVTTLRTFFDNNRNVAITTRTLKDGHNYNCVLSEEPNIKDRGADHKDVTQSLEGTRN